MKQEWPGRLKNAAEYQKKAILALFPKGAREHLEVIEGELRLMALELMAEVLAGSRKDGAGGEGTGTSGGPGVKKVDIG